MNKNRCCKQNKNKKSSIHDETYSGYSRLPACWGSLDRCWKKPASTLSCGRILTQLLFHLFQQGLQCCRQTGGGVVLERAQQAKERLLAEEALLHSAHQRLQWAAAGICILSAATQNLEEQQQQRIRTAGWVCVCACVCSCSMVWLTKMPHLTQKRSIVPLS